MRAQIAVDTTFVSALGGAAHRDGVALAVARRQKERTYPESVAPWSRCRLVVMANEVGGRWLDIGFLASVGEGKGAQRDSSDAAPC